MSQTEISTHPAGLPASFARLSARSKELARMLKATRTNQQEAMQKVQQLQEDVEAVVRDHQVVQDKLKEAESRRQADFTRKAELVESGKQLSIQLSGLQDEMYTLKAEHAKLQVHSGINDRARVNDRKVRQGLESMMQDLKDRIDVKDKKLDDLHNSLNDSHESRRDSDRNAVNDLINEQKLTLGLKTDISTRDVKITSLEHRLAELETRNKKLAFENAELQQEVKMQITQKEKSQEQARALDRKLVRSETDVDFLKIEITKEQNKVMETYHKFQKIAANIRSDCDKSVEQSKKWCEAAEKDADSSRKECRRETNKINTELTLSQRQLFNIRDAEHQLRKAHDELGNERDRCAASLRQVEARSVNEGNQIKELKLRLDGRSKQIAVLQKAADEAISARGKGTPELEQLSERTNARIESLELEIADTKELFNARDQEREEMEAEKENLTVIRDSFLKLFEKVSGSRNIRSNLAFLDKLGEELWPSPSIIIERAHEWVKANSIELHECFRVPAEVFVFSLWLVTVVTPENASHDILVAFIVSVASLKSIRAETLGFLQGALLALSRLRTRLSEKQTEFVLAAVEFLFMVTEYEPHKNQMIDVWLKIRQHLQIRGPLSQAKEAWIVAKAGGKPKDRGVCVYEALKEFGGLDLGADMRIIKLRNDYLLGGPWDQWYTVRLESIHILVKIDLTTVVRIFAFANQPPIEAVFDGDFEDLEMIMKAFPEKTMEAYE